MRQAILPVALLATLAIVPSASATPRYASPFSTDTGGACTVTACRLDRALAVAEAGDLVLLEDGPYAVGFRARATKPVIVRPLDGRTQPRLIGAAGQAHPTLELTAGGTVSGLSIETSSAVALQLGGGARGIGLELYADGTDPNGVAARLLSAPGTTALLNSVARIASAYTAVEAVDGPVPGGVAMVHVTAVATGGNSWGITTELSTVSPVLTNSIVRAPAKALHGRSSTQPVLVTNSNFPTAGAANWTDVGGNQKDVALTFAGQATGNLRPAGGARTIDAGVVDPLTVGTADPDGRVRLAGTAPDIGAYEHDAPLADLPRGPAAPGLPAVTPPAGTGARPGGDTAGDGGANPGGATTAGPRGAALPTLPAVAAPITGERVAIAGAGGVPRVRLPGASRFVPLDRAAAIPVGSVVDATNGRVRLTSVRDGKGRTQTGEFWGGRFVVRQSKERDAYTELVLTGSSFAGCPSARSTARAAVATKRRKRRTVVRSLWGEDSKGRFRTRGKASVATVRGTVWLVEDRCDGTLTRVRKGAVEVRDLRSGRTKLVRAGGTHLVPGR